MKKFALLLLPLLLQACATRPELAEVPIEEAQRRMVKEPPVLVADGCLYRRNLAYVNQFIIDESRTLAEDGAKEVIEGFKKYGNVSIKQKVVPVMCATEMPPRGIEKGGSIAPSSDKPNEGKSLTFPEPMSPVVEGNAELFAAYTKLYGDCDEKRYRKERRYDCPLLSPEQAALLKSRLKTSYVVALSVGGEKLSTANRSAGVVFGLLFGAINIGGDLGTARVRLVNLDTGALVYSSFLGDFQGNSAADSGSGFGNRSSVDALLINEKWVEKMVKPLFEKQR